MNPLFVLIQANLSNASLRNNSWVDLDEGRALVEVNDAQLCVLTFCENDYGLSIDGTVLDSNVTLTEYDGTILYPVMLDKYIDGIEEKTLTQFWEAQPGKGLLSCDVITSANFIMPYLFGNLTILYNGQYITKSSDTNDMAQSDSRQTTSPLNRTSGPLANYLYYDLEQRLRNIGISLPNNQEAN